MELHVYIRSLDHCTAQALLLAGRLREEDLVRRAAGGWSIGQVLEHICVTERKVCNLLLKPSDRLAPVANLLGAERLRTLLVEERHRIADVPEGFEPARGVRSVAAFDRQLVLLRGNLKRHLLSGVIPTDRRIHAHPLLGDMTISDWLYFMVYHTERHCWQIHDILEGAGAR